MSRQSFPEIPVEALRSHAQPERVERVWRRLSLDVSRRPRSAPAVYFWAPAAAATIFGLGVLVGVRSATPQVEVAAVAEPRAPLPVPGAGPVVERQQPAAEQHDQPEPKHARPVRAQPVDAEVAEVYPESYGEIVSQPAFEPLPAPATPSAWESLAEAGDFKAANSALDREGGFEQALQRASASQLMVLADIARAAGNREQAMRALRQVVSAYLSAPGRSPNLLARKQRRRLVLAAPTDYSTSRAVGGLSRSTARASARTC
jgi:hypothetical protein